MAITNRTLKKHNQVIVKSNDIIQKAQHQLTEQQQDILAYMVAEIKADDEPNKVYTFSIRNYCEDNNLDNTSGYYYQSIKDDIEVIDTQRMFLIDDKNSHILKRLRWLNIYHINVKSGEIMYNFHQDIQPYLFQLGNRKTIIKYKQRAALSGKYAKCLYELMKSYQNMETVITIPLDRLKFVMNAEKYKRFPDFRRWALEPAIDEINRVGDIIVKARYEKGDKGKAITQVGFFIYRADGLIAEKRQEKAEERLGY